MYKGERLVEQQKYEEAIPYLQETLKIAPRSDKAALLEAKACLEIGDVEGAQKALQDHDRGHFEDAQNPRFIEVEALWKRALQAVDKAEQAAKLAEQPGRSAQAAMLMHEAAGIYPEASGLKISAELLDEGAAFERKDYDKFLSITQKEFKAHPGPETAASLASALACEYATTGNVEYQKQAEDMLSKAAQASQGNADAMKSYDEYAERIRYRLTSRVIIDKPEYDRKFRAVATQPK
jgi:tetratricopeptide (TPR) repeat protein